MILRFAFLMLLPVLALWLPTGSKAEPGGRLDILEAVDLAPHLPARTIRIYLPQGYDTDPRRRWPVIYLHDGQNLFDARTAFAGEWQADEAVDRLVAAGKTTGWIIVGIDNGGAERLNEYAPWPFEHAPVAKGAAHAAAVAEVLKPLIDRSYRTDPTPQATVIGGSSMGAVIGLYTALSHPDQFGGVLAMSGSWTEEWMMPALRRWVADLPPPPAYLRVYLDVGVREWNGTEEGVTQTREVERILRAAGLPTQRLRLVLDPAGEHRESSWARRLPDALLWLSGAE